MFENRKKGFTVVELVIVIGVIGILSAILIPTFINLSEKSREAADQAAVKNMTTLIEVKKVEKGVNRLSLEESYEALKEGGFDLKTIAPANTNRLFGFNADTSEIGLFNQNRELVYSIGKDEETVVKNFATINENGLDLYLKSNYTFKQDSRMNLNIYSSETINVTIDGTIIGNVTIDAPNANITQYGIIDGDGYGTTEDDLINYVFNKGNLVVNDASFVSINGYVDILSASDTTLNVESEGVIREILEKESLILNNDGWINYLANNTDISVTNNGFIGGAWKSGLNNKKAASFDIPLEYNVSNTEELLKASAKTQDIDLPYNSAQDSAGTSILTLNITNNVNVDRVGFIPFACWHFDRSSIKRACHMVINGGNHTISNLRNNFLGAIGAKSTITDLNLIMNYESSEYASPYENIFYYNDLGKIKTDFIKSSGGAYSYYASASDEANNVKTQVNNQGFFMHIGCLANWISAVNGETNKVIVNNLNVGGKYKFSSTQNGVYYCIAVVAGGIGISGGGNIATFTNIKIANDFDCEVKSSDGNYYYGKGSSNKVAVFVGNLWDPGSFTGNGVEYNPQGNHNTDSSCPHDAIQFGDKTYIPWITAL